MHTLIDPALLADLAAPHPPAERLQRLASQLRAHFHCGAVVLLRLEEEHLRPVAMDGLVPEALGRRFAVRQHPRLAAILARREVVCFDHDSTLPDPYDGLLDTLVGAPLPVHDCMGVALWVEERPWGVLTLDALRTGTFGAPERAALAHCARLAEAAVRMAQLEREVQALRLAPPARAAAPAEGAAPAADPDAEIVGQSPALTQLLHELRVVASSALPVLLLGETGVGKELFARWLHRHSPRHGKPLVHVNCAALPETLAESELFGHVRGAFSGAMADRPGRFEAAEGGTLFLDEVGDIPLSMQVKLLRLLEGGTYRRVGQTELRRADIRLVAATHRDLRAMVREGRFRQDLYYRLSTFPIQLPALRERAQDIPLLAESLLQRVAPGRRLTLSPAALRCLVQHPFPGNVRELRNVLERAALLTDGDTLTGPAVARALSFDQGARAPEAPGGAAPGADLRSLEAAALRSALQTPGRTRRELAQALGISPRTLYRKLRALQL